MVRAKVVLSEQFMGKEVAKDGWRLGYKLSNLLILKTTQAGLGQGMLAHSAAAVVRSASGLQHS